jgi:uncharacterized protein (TIGR03663 family)
MIFDRTFHPDEANQAFTVGKLLETGQYVYQPEDHHGPTLYYAAAALQKAYGHDSIATLDGTLLRCTPLLFAVLGLVFGFLALYRIFTFKGLNASKDSIASKGLNALKAFLAMALLGTSPIFVFFATDFIQEMLLACFTLMMFWAGTGYLLPGDKWKPGTWALLFGVASGLAFATKETSLLTFAAVFLAFVGIKFSARNSSSSRASGIPGNPETSRKSSDYRSHVILALAGFLLTAIIFYSSFCSNWQGVYNAFIAAPLSYLNRAAGSATSTGANWHVHPWWQYFLWLFSGHLPLANYICLGLTFGILSITFGRAPRAPGGTFLFTTTYALLLLAFYSAIPYKTPWCALQILVPLLLAPFLGCINFCEALHSVALEKHRAMSPKTISVLSYTPLLCLAALLLYANVSDLVKMWRDPDSPDIPCNYAAASPEVKDLAATVAAAMESQTSKPETPFVAVALPAADTWPFPWYNRNYERQTGYWNSIGDLKSLADAGIKPTVVIVPMEEGHLVQPMFPHLKHTKRFYMRPRIPERKVRGVRVRVFW